MRTPAIDDRLDRPVRELAGDRAAHGQPRHCAQEQARFAAPLGLALALHSFAIPSCLSAIRRRSMALCEEAVPILAVFRAHPGVVDDMLRVAQRPTRVTTGVALGPISKTAAVAPGRLFGRKRAASEALLERRLLATRMDPRRAASRRARIAPLCKGQSLHARSARDQLDRDAVAFKLPYEVVP
jgi:hypothetical protein